ncbi:carbohydrate ABC transporter permease [Candidatus Aerophobetes bacterium]|nr:carbohydrate ABC transporter permease [Candidatus Aerophobetes bacterium]
MSKLKGICVAYLVLIFVCIYNLVTFIWMLSTFFKTLQQSCTIPPTLWPQKPTSSAYSKILIYGNFPLYFFNSTIVASSTALFSTFIGLLAGYGFPRFSFKEKMLMMAAVLS